MAGDINFVTQHGRGAKREMRTRDRARSDQVFGRAESIDSVCSGPMSGTGRAWQPDPEGIVTTFDPIDKRLNSPTQLDYIQATSDIAHHLTATALNSKNEGGSTDHRRIQMDEAQEGVGVGWWMGDGTHRHGPVRLTTRHLRHSDQLPTSMQNPSPETEKPRGCHKELVH